MPRLSKARKELLTTMMKEAIFDATTSVLCEHGVDGTTMNRVADAAALSKSSLYDYFQNKDELLAFVFDRIAGPFLKTIEELVPASLPAPHKLETILRTALEHSTQHKAIFRMLEESGQNERVKRRARPRILEAFTAIYEQGIREGSFQPHNPAHTARMFAGCLSELFEMQVSGASNEAAADYIGVLVGAVRHGFSIHVAQPAEPNAAGLPPPP